MLYLFNNIVLYFISIHLYILEKVLSRIFFYTFKNVITKSDYWIYQQYFEYLKNKNYILRLLI